MGPPTEGDGKLPSNSNQPPNSMEEQLPLSSQLPPYDETDGGMNVNVNVNYQEVADATPIIFTSFLVDRADHDGHDVPESLRQNQEEIQDKKFQ